MERGLRDSFVNRKAMHGRCGGVKCSWEMVWGGPGRAREDSRHSIAMLSSSCLHQLNDETTDCK